MKRGPPSWCGGPDPGLGGRRPTRCTAAFEEFDDDHAAAATRTWRATIGCSAIRIGGVVRRCRLFRQRRGGNQLSGVRDVRFATGAREQPIMADAVEPLG